MCFHTQWTLTNTYRNVNASLVCKCAHKCTHPPFLACAHHFTIMRTDLWPWGQMIVLNSITVRVLPTLHIHCSSTVTLCWCSSKINAPTLPPPSPLEAMFYMFSLIRPRVILIMSLAKEEWLEWYGLKRMSLTPRGQITCIFCQSGIAVASPLYQWDGLIEMNESESLLTTKGIPGGTSSKTVDLHFGSLFESKYGQI